VSPPRSWPKRRNAASDEGFSLIEVAVAIAIFALAVAALAPLMIKATQLTTTSTMNTQAKQLGLTRVESMRNLPYWIAFDNGQYRDVLDIYFRDRVAVGDLEGNDPCSSRGYAAASATYRCTIAAVPGFPNFGQVIDVQFLDSNRQVVTPPPTYNARAGTVDTPITQMIGVAVTTSWQTPAGVKTSVLRTQIANGEPAPKQLQIRAEAVALRIGSFVVGEASEFRVEAGLVTADGALSTSASAGMTAVGAQAGLTSGASVTGAAVSQSAPADAASAAAEAPSAGYGAMGCAVACIGPSAISGSTAVAVSGGVPLVATAASPAAAKLRRGVQQGLSFSNAGATSADPALLLDSTAPMVGFGSDGGTSDVVAEGSAYLTAFRSPVAADARASVKTLPIRILPTTFAPDGLVQIELHEASIACISTAGAGTPSANWSATVRVWTIDRYATYTVSSTSDAALPAPSTIAVTSTQTLAHWIDSWTAATSAQAVQEASGRVAKGSLPSAVTAMTKPTRGPADPGSAIAIEVGRLGCLAEDHR
jgi:prepilin-type N-terminal cleavage/methylation domain-containing protein